MGASVQNLVMSLAAVQVARKIPFDNPQVLHYARVAYVAAHAIILGTYYATSIKIRRKNDRTVVRYVKPPSPFSEKPKHTVITTTIRDYELCEISKLLRSVYVGVTVTAIMHLYLKYTQPLFVQAIMGLKNLYDAKPVATHLFATFSFAPFSISEWRPFRVRNPFGDVFSWEARFPAS